MNTPNPPNQISVVSHYYWLDWLRFLAALLVVIGHTRFQHFGLYSEMLIPCKGVWSEILFLIPRLASEAVTVFFVLSGFLVGGKTLEKAMAGRFDGISFAIDRSVRVWLPLIPTVLITWCVSAIRGEDIRLIEGIGNIFAVQGVLVEPMFHNSVLWSLSFEIWFYAAALGFGLFLNDRGRVVWVPLLLITLVFTIFSSLGSLNLFIWLLGALVFFLQPGRWRWHLLTGGVICGFIGGLLSALISAEKTLNLPFLNSVFLSRSHFLLLLGLGVSLTLPVLVRLRPARPWLTRLNRCGTGLAAWSYSLYLIHRPVLNLWSHFHSPVPSNQVTSGSVILYLLKIGSCLGVAWVFWLIFESQTDRIKGILKKKFIR